jgi:hypothetical protein
MGFLATFLGAAFGVVAGALIQYLFTFLIERRNRRRLLSDLQIETRYNLVVVDQMLEEVRRFRAAANPSAFESYQWFYRTKDMLSIALRNVVQSGQFYKMFSQDEILGIQKAVQFFDATLEQNFIVNKINQLKQAKDVPGAHQFANYLEGEINTHKRTIETVLRQRK